MSKNPPQKWIIQTKSEAQKVFDGFTATNKRIMFRQLKQLLEAEAPYNLEFVETVKNKSLSVGDLRRFRVGDFRVFFVLEPFTQDNSNLNENRYKGKLTILHIRNRRDAYKD